MKTGARFGVTEMAYHYTSSGEKPTTFETRFGRLLESDEQPYVRKLKVTEEWKPLDCGWLTAASFLFISNDEGEFRTVVPTKEARVEATRRVVQIGFGAYIPHILIRPQESARFEPGALTGVFIRCIDGEARCTLALVPE